MNIFMYFRTPEWFAKRDTRNAVSLGFVNIPVYGKSSSKPPLPPQGLAFPVSGESPDCNQAKIQGATK